MVTELDTLCHLARVSDQRSEPVKRDSKYNFSGIFAELGFLEKKRQKEIGIALRGVLILSLCSFLFISFFFLREVKLIVAAFVSFLAVFILLVLICRRKMIAKYHETLLFELPFFIENILLLCSSGFGLTAAIQNIVSQDKQGQLSPFFIELLGRIENGSSVNAAIRSLAEVSPIAALRHVFIQLDLSTETGAPVTEVLNALNEYSVAEWKISVESTIRKIEVGVVFPVFAAVLGFLLLIASGPIISIVSLDLRSPDTSKPVFNGQEEE